MLCATRLVPCWHPDFWSFHSPAWWAKHWNRTELVEVTHADLVSEGWKDWLDWLEICAEPGYRSDPQDAELVRVDAGRNVGLSRIVSTKRAAFASRF